MAISSEWAGPPVEWAGLPVSPTLPYLRVSKLYFMRPGLAYEAGLTASKPLQVFRVSKVLHIVAHRCVGAISKVLHSIAHRCVGAISKVLHSIAHRCVGAISKVLHSIAHRCVGVISKVLHSIAHRCVGATREVSLNLLLKKIYALMKYSKYVGF